MKTEIVALVLAAGKGTRMKSDLPKVLHKVGSKMMIEHVLDALTLSGISKICVLLGGDLSTFRSFMEAHPSNTFVEQLERRGTGDAVAAAGFGLMGIKLPIFAKGRLIAGQKISASHVMISAGDTPLLDAKEIAKFYNEALDRGAMLSILAMRPADPKGYGRLITAQDGSVLKIVEEKDADENQKQIDLCNSGIIFAEIHTLFDLLQGLGLSNAQGEYLLTDIISIAKTRSISTSYMVADHWERFLGVNDPEQLRVVSEILENQNKL